MEGNKIFSDARTHNKKTAIISFFRVRWWTLIYNSWDTCICILLPPYSCSECDGAADRPSHTRKYPSESRFYKLTHSFYVLTVWSSVVEFNAVWTEFASERYVVELNEPALSDLIWIALKNWFILTRLPVTKVDPCPGRLPMRWCRLSCLIRSTSFVQSRKVQSGVLQSYLYYRHWWWHLVLVSASYVESRPYALSEACWCLCRIVCICCHF